MNLTNNTIVSGTSWKLKTPIPSTLIFGSTALLNAYTWNAGPGKYQLTAYAPPGVFCNDSATVTVEVISMLIPNNITGLDTVCANTPSFYTVAPNMSGVTYNWTVTGGTIIGPNNGSSVSISWNPGGGSVFVTQTLIASPFCTSLPSAIFVVKTWPNFTLPVITTSNSVVCLKSNVTYSIPPSLISNGTYTWSVVPATAGNIITANGTNTITIRWISAAITPIWVKLKITRCYSDSVMFPINLLPLPPVPNINYTPPFPCENDVVSFTTTSPGPSWNWNFGDLGISTLQNPTHAYTAAGTYNIRLFVTNANGCSDTAYTSIKVNGKPVVPVITGLSSVCINTNGSYSFSQPLFQGANYAWSLSAPVKGSILSFNNSSVLIKWTTAGIDTVKLRVQSPCIDTTIRYVVTINPLPTPGISGPSSACQNSSVTFNGSGGASYTWSFTGGSPALSNLQSPSITYSVPGKYNVSLSVTSAAGCTNTTTTSITINPLPIALISGPGGVCTFPATVTLAAVALNGYTFAWSPSGITPSITNTINAPTTFSCVVTNAFGCSLLSNSITINSGICDVIPGPCTVNDTIDFTSTPPICLSQSYTKIGGATLTGWSFGAGGSAGATSPVTATYPYPGVYPVQVIGTATGLDANGLPCSKVVAKTRMMTIPFDAKFEYSFQCNGSNQMQTIFNNTSLFLNTANLYNWTWYDVTTASTLSTQPFPAPQLLSVGTHTVNLYIFDPVTMATCTTTHTFTVPPPVIANFTVTTPVCQGTAAIFTNTSSPLINVTTQFFNNGNGGTSTLATCSLVYVNSGPFNATLNVTDKYGCTSFISKPVNVFPQATGTITVGSNNCDSVQLTASGIGPYTWNVINPPPSPDNPVYVKTSGYYSVTATDINGCPYTVGPVLVAVKPSPNATIVGKTQYCQGENLDIKTQTAGSLFVWQQIVPAGPIVGGNTPNLTIPLNTPGTFTYQVTVTGLNGCTAIATYTIVVDPVPSSAVIVGGPLTFCDGDSVTLTVSPPGATYLWSKSPTPALSSPANTNDSLFVKVSGTYSVIVQTPNGCAYPAIAPVTVTVNPTPPANITGDTVLCEGETLALVSTIVGGVSYAWTGPSLTGNTNPFIAPNIQLTNAGLYVVVVTDLNTGCTNTDTITVIVNPLPATPSIISNPGGVLCEGQVYNLSVVGPLGPPIVYNWSTGQIGTNINAYRVGSYFVTATNQFGCTASSNVITIHPLPDLSCAPSGCYEFCNECDSVTIPGPDSIFTYNWEILVGNVFNFYSSSQNLTVYPPGGKYRLIAANQWGCSDTTDTISIDFKDCCPPPDTINCKDTCYNFDNMSLNGWQPHPSAPNVGVGITNVMSQGGVTDYYITATDQPGPSRLLAGSQFNGKWCCGTFCFDYKLVNDGGTGNNVNPSFVISSGTLSFQFTSTTTANVANGWHSICAPISDCNPPPFSPSGIWTPLGATLPTDWTTVLSNVTEVVFRVDYIASADNEISGYDNVCINSTVPNIDAGNDTTICAGSIVTLHAEGCNAIPEWNIISGDSLIFYANGPIIDVMPLQTTCYVVTCCNVDTCCCASDTICINVNPLPIIIWPANYPDVCLNSDSIFLDANNIFVLINNLPVPITSTNGTWVFSGTGVIGNYFYPTTLGPNIITVQYTDSNGCSSSKSIIINVIFCCNTSCQVDAGADTTICAGSVLILNAQGCSGTSTWYQLGAAGPIFVGPGPVIDVTPQQNTCYMVICCCIDPVYNITCCDTDTICVNVLPPVHLDWPYVLPDVCLNSAPVFIDANNIYVTVGNNSVPITSTTGTWVFVGPNVIGNFFYPNTLGPHTITVIYTDPNGCIGTVSININVILCCGTSCQVDAGADTTICAGSVAILNAQGCSGTSTWYQLGTEGPIFVGPGPIIDVTPQQTTCYMVICCCVDPVYNITCCDTDTICVSVFPPVHLDWPYVFPDVCLNSAPVFIDANNIYVTVGNNSVPITSTTGTWVFVGPNVIGNFFYPNTLGPHTITVIYTDPNGCIGTVSININVILCCGTSCQVDAGADTTICAGSVAILNAQGCSGTSTWYQLGTEGPIFVGPGPIIDVTPQQTTCYMVICCCVDPVYNITCCDTDTICVSVFPPVHLDWPYVFPDVCLNSAPVFIDANNIYVTVGNNSVPITSTTGTWVFVGPNVTGNFFYPNTLGPHTITVIYTDPNGCTGTVSININVIFCCGTSCQVDAGADVAICAGSVAILTAQGCSGASTWYQLGTEGPIFVGQGPVIDVTPQQNTCYMVICCCIDPVYNIACCDTDTVCVNVFPPVHLDWPYVFPDICLNSAPVFIDANNIYVTVGNNSVPITSTTGTWVFVGPNVTGNFFYPNTLGPHTITVIYTDPNGCTGTVSININVIFCCGTSCQVDAGADVTICAGNVAILNAQGCSGTSTWYQLGSDAGPIFVGPGPVIDVTPQQTTCYMVICCCIDPIYNITCCDTDTVCVNVFPPVHLDWPYVLPDVCLNSTPVFLDANNIYVTVGNNWVPITSTTGTWVFVGPNVVGNFFYPNTLGPQTITVIYTDPNGCTGTVSININVIFCCGTSCQVDAGADVTICAGEVAILNAQGCSGNPSWYQLGPEGPVFVNNGPILDVFPQQTTCYIVICCCPVGPVLCCDTDTICVNVHPPVQLNWPISYADVCQYGAPIFLDANNVFVNVNNNWVPITSTGGSWTFSGPGVFGNNFVPNTLGPNTITVTYTDPVTGCIASASITINVIFCCGTSCHVDAGSDVTICSVGNVATLVAQGCNGNANWYQLGAEGPVFVHSGPIFDVSPQQTTCYMVICCCPVGPVLCCDTDTVCVNVYPPIQLLWPVSFADVCLNSAPIFLDANNIYVYFNNNSTSITLTGGTWTFSGLSVFGNFFIPNILGPNVITLNYTDPNGCTGTVSITINVVLCCETTCLVDAGSDITICAGNPAILNAQGCNGSTQWFQLGPEGPVFVGQGPILDVFPQQTTCYMVVCCCPDPVTGVTCCHNDTVCVSVNPPIHLDWPVSFNDVCVNSTPIFLDANNIFVTINNAWVPITSTGGTWVFSGTGVVGNFFNPNTIGTHVITVTYTDPNGCMGTVSITINVVFCCGTACQVNAGNDTTICAGNVAILNAQGCSGISNWYQLGTEGPIFVGQGPIFDVTPQQNTCYMVVCCCIDPIYNTLCCDTDTVCVNVSPPLHLDWPYVFQDACLNSAPVFIDANNIYVTVGNNWVPITSTGGTWVFAGANVSGNYFNPVTLGINTITVIYTDPNGCTGNISITINVINCCGNSCQVDAGSDQVICAGTPAILNAQGCNGSTNWYQISPDGPPIFIHNGPVFDVFPQSNTCYMVICCCPNGPTLCCDTDTVCVTVTPSPILSWPLSYANVCINGAAVFLNVSNIFVYVGNTWVPASGGFFSGNGVFGNYFYPTSPGNHVITYHYTDANGCTGTVTNTIKVVKCKKVKLDLHVLLEGYYTGGGLMDNYGAGGLLGILNISPTLSDADTLVISAIDPLTLTLVDSETGILQTDGSITVDFDSTVAPGLSYYIKVNHRNAIETWSASPVLMDTVSTYDFTTSQTQAYGNNMVETFDHMGWALYSGDMSDALLGLGHQDGLIESQDYGDMENASSIYLAGYVYEDITGDGLVESADYSLIENNVTFYIQSLHP
jgi:PKD repeat protein